jgi:TolB protein
MDIYIMAIDGSGIVNITNDEIEDYSPSWSPDGNWISFTSGNASNYDI